MKNIGWVIGIMLLFASCGEYNKILKSTDYELKYSYAKKYFDEKKYAKAATLLEELVPIFKGTTHAEESLYLLAQTYYSQKDYETAAEYFKTYYTTYPKGEYAEQARFYSGSIWTPRTLDLTNRKPTRPLRNSNSTWNIIRRASAPNKPKKSSFNCRKNWPTRSFLPPNYTTT